MTTYTQPTNATRAEWGSYAIAARCDQNDPETDLSDTLANLMHYADQHAIDWESALITAALHHDCELYEERLDRCISSVTHHQLEMDDPVSEANNPDTNIGICMQLGPEEYERQLLDT
jgi:hypothetical protein